jgi:hypothetical protein
MFGYIPEEMSWAAVQEHELEARRIARSTTRRGNSHSLRALVARKLVQTGLRLDDDAGIAVLKHAEGVS